MIWILVIGFVLSLVINESDAIEMMDEIKKEIKVVVVDKTVEKEALSYAKEMKKALIESEKIKKKSLRDFYFNLENEEGLENLQSDFNIVYKNLEIERSKLLDSRESLLSTLSPEDWDKIFSEL